eukprot:484672-Pelagomonas_calceolata.AAC.1
MQIYNIIQICGVQRLKEVNDSKCSPTLVITQHRGTAWQNICSNIHLFKDSLSVSASSIPEQVSNRAVPPNLFKPT